MWTPAREAGSCTSTPTNGCALLVIVGVVVGRSLQNINKRTTKSTSQSLECQPSTPTFLLLYVSFRTVYAGELQVVHKYFSLCLTRELIPENQISQHLLTYLAISQHHSKSRFYIYLFIAGFGPQVAQHQQRDGLHLLSTRALRLHNRALNLATPRHRHSRRQITAAQCSSLRRHSTVPLHRVWGPLGQQPEGHRR